MFCRNLGIPLDQGSEATIDKKMIAAIKHTELKRHLMMQVPSTVHPFILGFSMFTQHCFRHKMSKSICFLRRAFWKSPWIHIRPSACLRLSATRSRKATRPNVSCHTLWYLSIYPVQPRRLPHAPALDCLGITCWIFAAQAHIHSFFMKQPHFLKICRIFYA